MVKEELKQIMEDEDGYPEDSDFTDDDGIEGELEEDLNKDLDDEDEDEEPMETD